MLTRLYRTISNLSHNYKSTELFCKTLGKNYIKQTGTRMCSALASKFPLQENLSPNEDVEITKDVVGKVNEVVAQGKEGRLFAVVHICGKQFKVTTEDIIIIEGYWPPINGDQIKLEKVLLVGGRDFTLVGRPILPQDLVSVNATVIEKDLSHTKTIFFKRRRKQYMRMNFYRSQMTMLRINDILIDGKINEHSSVTQYSRTWDS
ncbi:mitochondrial ribosomal protein L21 [Rhodnius prolixus]